MNDFLSFSEGLLGPSAQKIPILGTYENGHLLAFNKPTGILIQNNPLFAHEKLPVLTAAIRIQLTKELPSFLAHFPTKSAQPIYALDSEISGVCLLSSSPKTTEYYRNLLGSDGFSFTFQFFAKDLTSAAGSRTSISCDLPIYWKKWAQKARISHAAGKKCCTHFTKVGTSGETGLWEAVTPYPRPHQIRLHAFECGLAIPREIVYTEKTAPIEQPKQLLGVHLKSITTTTLSAETLQITAPLPKAASH